MKLVIPWALSALLLAGTVFLYSANKQKDIELEKWRQIGQDSDRPKSEGDPAKDAMSTELSKFKGEHEELLALRSEAQRLRTDNRQLTTQLTEAKTAGMHAAQTAQETQQKLSQLAAEKETLAKMADAQGTVQQQAAACIANLRTIETAKHQWAIDNNKAPDSSPTMADLVPYIPKNVPFPFNCPAGGGISIGAIDVPATCTIPGHVLQQ